MRGSFPFEAFNARVLEPDQVARTFVLPSQFADLVKRRHTVVVGPRGSGKTTLLKMLQGAALEAWRAPEAEEYRKHVDYTGVFVPADRAWNDQINAIAGNELDSKHCQLLGRAAFTTHTLLALVKAVHYRMYPPDNPKLIAHRRVCVTMDQEADLANLLSIAWQLELPVASIAGVILGLTNRLCVIPIIASQETLQPLSARGEGLAQVSWLHLGVIESIVAAIEAFEQLTGEREARWSLLFDELELAPKWARELLFSSIRSVDQRLLFKLSLSPVSQDTQSTEYGPLADHDHDVIPLWYPHKEDARHFCRTLLASMMRSRGLAKKSAEQLLGRSYFDAPYDESSGSSAYMSGSAIMRRFERLAHRDSRLLTTCRSTTSTLTGWKR